VRKKGSFFVLSFSFLISLPPARKILWDGGKRENEVPIRGARVRRSDWFRAVEAQLRELGFQRCGDPMIPGHPSAPGRYFFERCGHVVQIASKQRLRILRPSGRNTEHHVAKWEEAILVLDALDLDIEFPD
jgi:hypothetical protein